MIKVGLTGGYASGKTFVAHEFERLGCHVIYADDLGHEVLLPGQAAYRPTLERFGPGILHSDGTIDRKQLGATVFGDRELLDALTSIVHPAVFQKEEDLMQQFAAADPQGIAMVEAAILIETGRFKEFDRLIVIACDEANQIARGMQRDGLSREEVRARIARQLPLAQKTAYADYVVDTNGTEEETRRQVHAIYSELRTLAEKTVSQEART